MVPFPVDSIVNVFANITLAKEAMAREAGLNLSQYLAVTVLGARPNVSCKEFKKSLDLPGSSATFILDSLEEKGLIARIRSKDDRRQWLIELTPKGRNLCHDATLAETTRIQAVLGSLSEEDRAAFVRICGQLGEGSKSGVAANKSL